MQWHFIVGTPQHCCPHLLPLITAFSLGFIGLTVKVFFQLLEETILILCASPSKMRDTICFICLLVQFLKDQ